MNTLSSLYPNLLAPAAAPSAPVAAAAPAASAPAAEPAAQQPAHDSVHINVAARAMEATGNALARVGGLAGTAIGAGLGVACSLALGAGIGNVVLPALGGLAVGFACADARGASAALQAGTSSPEFLKRVQAHRTQTPISSGCIALTTLAGVGSIGAGLALAGGPLGLVAGVGGALVSSLVLGVAAYKGEKALLAAQR